LYPGTRQGSLSFVILPLTCLRAVLQRQGQEWQRANLQGWNRCKEGQGGKSEMAKKGDKNERV